MFGFSCVEWTIPNVLIRIVVSMILGCVIGLDRGLKKRGAGTKTNTIVCLGATLVMLTAQYMEVYFPGKSDLSRMASQVISGVGFLGVGTILVTEKQRVRGLTTAAGLWACACVGLAIGIGFVEGAVYTLVFIVVVLRLLNKIDIFLQKHAKVFDLYLELENGKSIGLFLQEMRSRNVKTETVETTKNKLPGKFSSLVVTLEVNHYNMRPELIDEIRNFDYVHYVEEM